MIMILSIIDCYTYSICKSKCSCYHLLTLIVNNNSKYNSYINKFQVVLVVQNLKVIVILINT